MKKCEQGVQVHRDYETSYQNCLQWLARTEEKIKKNSDVQGNREEILEKIRLAKCFKLSCYGQEMGLNHLKFGVKYDFLKPHFSFTLSYLVFLFLSTI